MLCTLAAQEFEIMVRSARKSMLGKRKNIPQPIPVQIPVSTVMRSAGKSMLGKRKNISRPIPIQPQIPTIERRGTGLAKRPECVNRSRARRKLWPPSEELLISNQNKDQDHGPQKKKRKSSADACSILASTLCRDNARSRFENYFHTDDTKENVPTQCSQHITEQTPGSLNKVGTSCFGDRPSLTDASLPLKSSYLSAQSVNLGETSPPRGCKVEKQSEVPKFLKSKIPLRSAAFRGQLATESSELCKTFVVSNCEGTGMNDEHEVIKRSKSRWTGHHKSNCMRSEFCNKSSSDLVAGALCGSTYVGSEKPESCISFNISGESCGIVSCGRTGNISGPFVSRCATSQSILGCSTLQNEKESHAPGNAVVYKYGEMKGNAVPKVLVSNHLQSHEGCIQPNASDVICHATEPYVHLKPNILQSASRFINRGMQECKEAENMSCYPTATIQCSDMSSQGSPFIRKGAGSKADTRQCRESVMNSRLSRLCSVGETMTSLSSPDLQTFTNFANPKVTNMPVVIESMEHENVSGCYPTRTTTDSSLHEHSQLSVLSGVYCSTSRCNLRTDAERKRPVEESTARYTCTPEENCFKQGHDKVSFGKPDEYTTCDMLGNVSASRRLENLPESNVLSDLVIPNVERTHEKLNVAASQRASTWMPCRVGVGTVMSPDLSESEVSLVRKSCISTNEMKNLQITGNENPTFKSSSVSVFQHDSHDQPSKMAPNNISTLVNGRIFAVSEATQTDLIVKNNTAIQTDSVICVKSDIEKLFPLFECVLKNQKQLRALFKKQEDEMCALENQTNIIHHEMINILNVFSDKQENKVNSDIMFEEMSNQSAIVKQGYSHKDSEECSRTPLRRSGRIAALAAANRSVLSTPMHLKSDGGANYQSAKATEKRSRTELNKSSCVYKELCSTFGFLRTPQSTKQPLVRTPKATPNQILKQRLKDQLQSLYD